MSKKHLLALLPCLMLAACTPDGSITLPSDIESLIPSTSDTTSTESEKPTPSESSSEEKPSSSEEETPVGPSYEVPSKPLTGYYAKLDVTAKGATLLSQARDIMVSTHTNYTSYNDNRGPNVGGLTDRTDYDPNNKNNIIMFYAKASISSKWDNGTTWNREHVWPQSLSSGNWGKDGGGSDMHHIRPSFNRVNGARGNKKYGEVSGGSIYKYSYNGKSYDCAKTSGDTWEPLDNLKGDVARIILYTFTHYNNPQHLEQNDNLTGAITSTANSRTSSGSMKITQVMDASTSEAFKMLSRWNKLDPVDELEINRNEAVFKIQHNRNPFIDHPWLVDAIWG